MYEENKLTTPDELDVNNALDDQVNETTDEEEVKEVEKEKSIEDQIWEADSMEDLDMDKLLNEPESDDDSSDDNKSEQELEGHEENQPNETEEQSGLLIKNPVLKFHGREIPVTSEEEIINLAQKGLKLETEMGKIKPQKKLIDLIESNKLTEEDLVAYIDALKGNDGAIQFLKKKLNITDEKSDYDDFFQEEKQPQQEVDYKPQPTSSDPVKEWFDDYVYGRPDLAGKVVQVTNEIDASFFKEIYSTDVFPGFVQHVESGMFDKVYPYALKIKATNPTMSWLTAYNRGVDASWQTEKPVEKKAPKTTKVPRQEPAQEYKPQAKSDYDKVWDDDEFYKDIKRKIG